MSSALLASPTRVSRTPGSHHFADAEDPDDLWRAMDEMLGLRPGAATLHLLWPMGPSCKSREGNAIRTRRVAMHP